MCRSYYTVCTVVMYASTDVWTSTESLTSPTSLNSLSKTEESWVIYHTLIRKNYSKNKLKNNIQTWQKVTVLSFTSWNNMKTVNITQMFIQRVFLFRGDKYLFETIENNLNERFRITLRGSCGAASNKA